MEEDPFLSVVCGCTGVGPGRSGPVAMCVLPTYDVPGCGPIIVVVVR